MSKRRLFMLSVGIPALFFVAGRIFNHANPWMGILLPLLVSGIVIYKLADKNKNKKEDEKE